MDFLPVNLDSLLVELDDLPQTLALLHSLQADPIPGVVDMVPAARTVMLRFRPAAISAQALAHRIGQRELGGRAEQGGTLIELPVDYQGEDIDEVAAILGIDRAELIRRHTGSEYRVAFTGFAPGFAYLSGGDPSLDVPRRATPRTRIPAGAVGLAGRFSGVYPTASPGGWQIIGVTPVPMWDLAREIPALLQPGYRVRFVDASARAAAPLPASAARRREARDVSRTTSAAGAGPCLEVIRAGAQVLFQDGGRPGLAGQGVSASGAMDGAACRAANRLVGNDADAACVEIVQGGFELACHGDAVVALTGAHGPIDLIGADGTRWPVESHRPLALADGDRLRLGVPRAGCRHYLAARGGFVPEPVLGSRSTDTLARLGPAPIAVGDRLPIGPARRGVVGAPEAPPTDLPRAGQVVSLDVVLGPRTDWFTAEAVERLASQPWTVTPQSNRVGLRLAGEMPLTRLDTAELPSEGTSLGAIQVPPNGQPVLFLADHPLTGGYPVIGAVATHHLDLAGQIPIGALVRFHPIHAFRRLSSTEPRHLP